MACDVDVTAFIEATKVDGNVRVWDDLPHPYRGWHLQECILTAYKFDFVTMVVAPEVFLGHDSEHLIKIKTDFKVVHKRAVLLTDTHAVATDGNRVFDPKGYIYPLGSISDYNIICLIFKINSDFCLP